MSDNLSASSGRRCQTCDAQVSERFAAVFGDNDDVIHECRECASSTRLIRGAGAGLDVDYQRRPSREPAVATDGGEGS